MVMSNTAEADYLNLSQAHAVPMDLFGKDALREENAELEDEIAELREERDRLQERLDAEQERLTAARRQKQDAEEEANRLRDRLRSLQDRLDADGDDPDDGRRRHTVQLGRGQTLELLDCIDALELPATEAETVIEGHEARLTDPWLLNHVIETPLPMEALERTDHGFITGPVRDQLAGRYLFVHLTAGGSGIAVIDDGEIVRAETIEADVKGDHAKGGYSQSRFERLREQQIADHLDAVLPVLDRFDDAAYDQALIAGSEQLKSTLIEETELELTAVSSDVTAITDASDLGRSFDSALGCRLHDLARDD